MPTKEQVRLYMRERQAEKTPPPCSAEIRRRFAQYPLSPGKTSK